MLNPPQPQPELARLQQWMQAVIAHPDGVTGAESPDGVTARIRPSQRMTAVERLEVYAGAYYTRLLECLEQEYPAVLHAVGGVAFDGLGFAYLQAYPSTSHTLADLGRHFPQFLAETRPSDADDDDPDWADFLIDLAHLERLYQEVFDGPGIEQRETLKPDDLLAIPTDRWPGVHFETAPCLRLAHYRFPVQSYASAVRKKLNDVRLPDRLETWLAVSRIGYRVRRWWITREQYRLLELLIAGRPLQDSLETAFAESKESDETIADDLRRWFREWAQCGFFLSARGE